MQQASYPFTVALLLAVTIAGFSSCDRPVCSTANEIFQNNPPGAERYKAELARQIRIAGADDLSFWFKGMVKENGRDQMLVYVQGTAICAETVMEVYDWHKLEGIKRTSGVSYSGAKLQGLRFDIVTDSQTHFVYRDLQRIID